VTSAAILATARAALAARDDLRLAIVFGSVAKGRARPDSDLDVAILPANADMSLAAELDLAADLSRATGREVDLVRLDLADPLTRFTVARDGVVVVANPRSAWTRFAVAAAREYHDLAPLLASAGELFRRRLLRDEEDRR
jgi:predicted nucleotidyltransferase